jgi:hypothetical protein
MYKKRLTTIFLCHLALGVISLFISFSYLGFIVYYYLPNQNFNLYSNFSITYVFSLTGYFLTFLITLIAGIFLIVSYHGFINRKKYSKSIGLLSCTILTIYLVYIIYNILTYFSEFITYASPSYIVVKIGQILLGLAAAVLLLLNIIFWNKLNQ